MKRMGKKTSRLFLAFAMVCGLGFICNGLEAKAAESSEIVFVETTSTVSYTGEAIELDESVVEVLAGTGEISFEYYLDEECTEITDVPVDAGRYYVKATISEDGEYTSDTTDETYVLSIRPRRVASVTVANVSKGIKISWKERTEADGYIISRRAKGTASDAYEVIASIEGADTLSFTDTNITQGKGYIYTIRAYKDGVDGTCVQGLTLKTAKKIVRTKVTSVTNQNGSIKVKWTKISSADGYKIYRKSSGDDGYKLIKTIKDSSLNYYTDKAEKALKNGKASYYYVKPYFEEDDGYVRTTDKKTNYYMTRPTINSVSGSNGAFTVKWSKNSKATGYQIRYSKSSSFDSYNTVKVTDKDTLSKKISDLTKNKKYYVKVRAYKTYNSVLYPSAWSAVKNVKTKGSSSGESSGGSAIGNEVWVSATGDKYHSINNCGRMNPDKARKMTKSEAEAQGLVACDKCF